MSRTVVVFCTILYNSCVSHKSCALYNRQLCLVQLVVPGAILVVRATVLFSFIVVCLRPACTADGEKSVEQRQRTLTDRAS